MCRRVGVTEKDTERERIREVDGTVDRNEEDGCNSNFHNDTPSLFLLRRNLTRTWTKRMRLRRSLRLPTEPRSCTGCPTPRGR